MTTGHLITNRNLRADQFDEMLRLHFSDDLARTARRIDHIFGLVFYRLYGHFAFVVNLTYLGLSSYIFPVNRGLMKLAAKCGQELRVTVEGGDEDAACQALQDFCQAEL